MKTLKDHHRTRNVEISDRVRQTYHKTFYLARLLLPVVNIEC